MRTMQRGFSLRIAQGRIDRVVVGALLIASMTAASAGAQEGSGASASTSELKQELDLLTEALIGGDLMLNVRARFEVADVDGVNSATGHKLRQSEAYTFRTRLGYGTKPYHGFSAYADFENIAAISHTQYWDGARSNSDNRSIIADPRTTEVNQGFGKFQRDDWLGSAAIVGRQRIVLDNARFIGDVGWRQNQQTYDSASYATNLGVDGLRAYYGYLWEIRRIYGDVGSQPNWNSTSHLVNVSYSAFEPLQATGFIYLLDFKGRSPGNSSASYGLYLHGKIDISDDVKLSYKGSYAYQEDYGSNKASYDTHYAMAEGTLDLAPVVAFGAGYEFFGSNDGKNQFVTPLATAHGFNGWADAFLSNGGPRGLQDAYIFVSPRLPWKFTSRLVYHHFTSDQGSHNLGDEFDANLGRAINQYISGLFKFAYYNGHNRYSPDDRWRTWLQLEFKL